MITINDATKIPTETTLNDIPVGTTFTGEVQNDAKTAWIPGLFLKTHGPNMAPPCKKCSLTVHRDVFVFLLTPPHHYMWTKCAAVRNYVPVNITINVEEVSK